MKKFLSMLLVLVLTLSMGTVAFAVGETDMSQVDITIKYTATNTGTTSPVETLKFNAASNGVTDGQGHTVTTTQPTLTVPDVQLSQGLAGNPTAEEAKLTITLPAIGGNNGFQTVGVYEYTITPNPGTSGGVTYHMNPIKLYVTVIQKDNNQLRIAAVHAEQHGSYGSEGKSNDINMTYSAGQLKVSKTVTGNMGERDKYFKVTVTLNGESGKTYPEAGYTVTGGTKITDGTTDATTSTITIGEPKDFYLKNDETIAIQNLPYGVTYTVAEADYTGNNGGYDAAAYVYSDTADGEADGSRKIDKAEETVTITNNKGIDVDTGIGLDSLPYIVMLAFVVIGLTVFFVKRRTAREN